MTTIRLSGDCPASQTIISNLFIDQYMPEANGEFVKIYLYLLRCYQSGTQDFSVSGAADLFNHTEADVIRALRYWERKGLLALSVDAASSITGIRLTAVSCGAVYSSAAPATATAAYGSAAPATETAAYGSVAPAQVAAAYVSAATVPASAGHAPDTTAEDSYREAALRSAAVPVPATNHEMRTYSADEVTAFSENPDIQELFFIIQTYLKHPLTATDTNTILFWYDELRFVPELIEYLVEYCISKGHSSTRYMNKVALSWADSGISTVEAAKENTSLHSQIYYAVMKSLGICGRNLVPSEMEYISRWTGEYHFSTELIQEACSRTIAATHQPSFEYTDSILSNWYKNGIKSPDDVKKADEEFSKRRKKPSAGSTSPENSRPANKFNNFHQRTYDEDELEAFLLNSTID